MVGFRSGQTSSRRFSEDKPRGQWLLSIKCVILYLYFGKTAEKLNVFIIEESGESREKHLIVYAKRPLAGYAKTRLGKKIGFEESAGVYARFLYQCLLDLIELNCTEISVELSLAYHRQMSLFLTCFP